MIFDEVIYIRHHPAVKQFIVLPIGKRLDESMQMDMIDTIVRGYVETETEFVFDVSLNLMLHKLVGVILFYNHLNVKLII